MSQSTACVSGDEKAYCFIDSTAASRTTLLSDYASNLRGSKMRWTLPSPIKAGNCSNF